MVKTTFSHVFPRFPLNGQYMGPKEPCHSISEHAHSNALSVSVGVLTKLHVEIRVMKVRQLCSQILNKIYKR